MSSLSERFFEWFLILFCFPFLIMWFMWHNIRKRVLSCVQLSSGCDFPLPYTICVLWFFFVHIFSFYVPFSPIICIWGPFIFVVNCRSLGVIITSVVPGDYDGDSQMDVLLTTRTQNHGKDELSVFIFWGHNQTLGELLRLLINKIFGFLNNSRYFQKVVPQYVYA